MLITFIRNYIVILTFTKYCITFTNTNLSAPNERTKDVSGTDITAKLTW